MSLSKRAVLASLHIRKFSGVKVDREAQAEVCDKNNAEKNSVKVVKNLLTGPALEAIRKLDTEARTHFYAITLPWMDDGSRIMASKTYVDARNIFNEYGDRFGSLLEEVCKTYEAEKEASKARLGGLYREGDYPSIAEIRAKFDFSFTVNPVPEGSDLRAEEISEEDRKELEANITARVQQAEAEAKKAIFARVSDACAKIADTLRKFNPEAKGDARGTFRDSLIDNVRELIPTLDKLNFDNDPRVQQVAEQLTEMTKDSANDLRESKAKRATVAASAEKIMRAMLAAQS